MKLILDPSSRRPCVLEAEDEEGLLDAWNALPWWSSYDGPAFAERLLAFTGADDPDYTDHPVELPAPDEEILAAVLDALGPHEAILIRCKSVDVDCRVTSVGESRRRTMSSRPGWPTRPDARPLRRSRGGGTGR